MRRFFWDALSLDLGTFQKRKKMRRFLLLLLRPPLPFVSGPYHTHTDKNSAIKFFSGFFFFLVPLFCNDREISVESQKIPRKKKEKKTRFFFF